MMEEMCWGNGEVEKNVVEEICEHGHKGGI